MKDLKQLFKDNYLKYASYVILDRAIPDVVDGLKPVQRRILWTLHQMDDGKLHKVANVAGQTMALHPHGDAPITEALCNLANKGYLLDRQGNFGNPNTGDPAAASRYIETRLSHLAKETCFNSSITPFVSSYDSRTNEPVSLPAKIPLLLMQGAEGIAVGMATKILSHNFKELLEAEIAFIEGRKSKILPDFLSGGIMDASDYDDGRGKIKLRAKIDIVDEKTLVIREICHGTTTESLIRSIDESAKKGHIKIDAINDYTAENVEIEIKLPRGQYADSLITALYAFTECEVTIHSQLLVIKDNHPWEASVTEVIEYHATLLQGYLKQELELERSALLEKIFQKTLEQIFIENRLYKKIEEVKSYEKIHDVIEQSLKPFHKQLVRVPTEEDREGLLSIPIRRISRFDIDKNQSEIAEIEKKLEECEKNLKNIKKFTVAYLQNLIKKYANIFPRRTKIREIEKIDIKEVATKKVKVGYDPETGFLGLKVSAKNVIECTNFDKLLIIYENGTYSVMNIPEKEYLHKESTPVWIGAADKTTTINTLYRDEETKYPYAKRFVIKQFILDKVYHYLDEGQKLAFINSHPNTKIELLFKAKEKQKAKTLALDFEEIAVKGVTAKGVRMANKELKSVKMISEGEES
jgi:topoisomerase-4 subunit A